jgi:hypothetical protein
MMFKLANELRTHNLPSGRLRNDFGEIDEAMFQGVNRPYEIIFCNTGIKKKRLGRSGLSVIFSSQMALGTHVPSGRLKINFLKVDEDLFQVVEGLI